MKKEGWEIKRFDEVFDLQMGRTPSRNNSQYWENGKHKWVSIGDMGTLKYISETKEKISDLAKSESKINTVPKGTVIMSFKLSIGKVAITTEDMHTNEAIMAFTPIIQNKLKTDFIYYYLLGYNWGASNRAVMGTTLNKASISSSKIKIPPLSIQEQIVAELDTLSDILAKKRQQLAELDTLAQASFYHLFGDPVENEKGWEVKRLEELVTRLGDGIHGTPQYSDDGEYYFINGNNLKDGKIIITPTTKKVSKEEAEIYKRELTNNTVFVSINGTIGNIAFYNNEKIMLGKSACYFNLKENYNKVFIYRLFKTDYFLDYAMGESTGSTIRNVSLKTMRNFLVPLPPLALQNQFAEQIEAIEKQKEIINQSITEVQKLFNYTMDKYFN